MGTADDHQAYLDEMAAARGYVLDYHKGLAAADFEVLKATNELIAATYLAERALDRKTKELLFVASLVVSRATKGHVQSHIRAALANGASLQEVLEAIEITLPEAGVVAFQAGFEAWSEVAAASAPGPGDPGSETPAGPSGVA